MRYGEFPIVVELSGIPYAGKTTIFFHLQNMMRESGIDAQFVEQYVGPADRYRSNKKRPYVTISRAIHSTLRISESAGTNQPAPVIFDRGAWDCLAWATWLRDGGETVDAKFIRDMLTKCTEISESYFVAFIKADPLVANSKHNRPGTIINAENLITLSRIYENLIYSGVERVKVIEFSTDDSDSKTIARSILQRTKILGTATRKSSS